MNEHTNGQDQSAPLTEADGGKVVDKSSQAPGDAPLGASSRAPGDAPEKAAGGQAWLSPLLDFGPLLIFFLVFKFTQSGDGALAAARAAINGTMAFMVAIIIAIAIAKWKLGRVSPMMWMTAVLILGFGALTVYFNDEKFIQIKPTIIYSGFAILLLGGWMRGKPLLRYLMEAVYDGLSEEGWLKLSRNWGLFFALLALLNEALRYYLDFDSWLTFKVWGTTAILLVFVLTQVPMLMRHGLELGDQDQQSDQ